jgi:transposase-like protein/ribosomal protein L37AE/L43A
MEFQERFATEQACREYLFASHWPEGFVCPVCGSTSAGRMHLRRLLWQCKDCGRQTSATAGTVMHGTRTPLRTWFWAAYLVATHHPGISAKQLRRQLGLARYETAWLMLHKLRRAMVAPEREPLKGEVEVDECWIGGVDPGRIARAPGKKTLVGVAVEVRGRGSGRLRLQPLPNASGPTLQAFVFDTVAPGAIVHSDGWRSYNKITEHGYQHRPRSQRASTAESEQPILPRAHRAIANLKVWLAGTHRGVSREHLHVYLDEYVFRHNRRRTPLAAFQTLLGLGAIHGPTTYAQITRRAA